jgi:GlcNAc-PI de-N-acetylase
MENSSHKPSQQFAKISFYIVAHADDWQLFMHPHVYNDLIAPDCKVIFIITTAGDAGLGEKYWAAREEGSKSSIRFCLAPLFVLSESNGRKEFNSHAVHYWSINNTTSYFLRLPDGNLDGSGFEACNFQSLFKLKSGQVNAITAIDNSATYSNWLEVVTTIESMISFESRGLSNIWIHYLNPDIAINRGDHPDHFTTGHAIQSMTSITALHQLLFVGYDLSSIQEPLPLTDLFWKAGMFAVYEKAVYDFCGYSTLQENTDVYARWCCSRPAFIEILSQSYQ